MSAFAEQLRRQALLRAAKAAEREAQELAAGFHVAWGLGGEPSQEAVERYNAACERAERLYLEYGAAHTAPEGLG